MNSVIFYKSFELCKLSIRYLVCPSLNPISGHSVRHTNDWQIHGTPE